MRLVVQLVYLIRRALLRLLRWQTRGVKVMVFHSAGELLLIRNSYGKSHLYVLPGGGIHRREPPETAAAREMLEETGLTIEAVRPFATYVSELEGKSDTVHLFTATTDGAPNADSMEVSEAGFYPLDRLPENVSDATLRRIAEYRGERPISGRW